MDRKDFSNLGEDIKEIVSEAVNSMDFHKLSQDIKKTTKDALEEAKAGLEAGRLKMQNRYGQAQKMEDEEKAYYEKEAQSQFKTEHRIKPGVERSWNKEEKQQGIWHGQAKQEQSGTYPAPDYRYGGGNLNVFERKKTPYLAKHPAGMISGTLMVVFGSMFSSGFAITAFVIFCIMIARGYTTGESNALFFGFFVSAIVSGLFAYRGNQKSLRVKRFRQYARILGNRTFCQIEELASQIGRDRRFVINDIRKMIAQGMFPQGHLDDQETCFMITDESYQQYRITMNEYRKREEQERKAVEAIAKESQYQEKERIKQEKKNNKKETRDSIYDNEVIDQELLNAYKEGKGYLDEISKVNKEISETQISTKVSHMEVVIRRIFKQVQTHPEQLEEIRRFMEYYLPTTLKLVTTYSEFDAQPVQGETIKKAKHEIEETLDTINEAFENLLDSLFEAAALDISTDISVMNAMLTQEGLKKDIFES